MPTGFSKEPARHANKRASRNVLLFSSPLLLEGCARWLGSLQELTMAVQSHRRPLTSGKAVLVFLNLRSLTCDIDSGPEWTPGLLAALAFWVLWFLCVTESFTYHRVDALVTTVFMHTHGLACSRGQRSGSDALGHGSPLPGWTHSDLLQSHVAAMPLWWPEYFPGKPLQSTAQLIYVQS